MREDIALLMGPQAHRKAITAKYMAFGYSGSTPADRERDEVIGFLLGEIENRDNLLADKACSVRSAGPASIVEERLSEFRRLVRERRTARGLSLRSAAEEIGIPFTVIAGAEKGERTPDSPALLALLAWLGLSLDWLTGGPSNAIAEYRRGWDDCAEAVQAVIKRRAG